jgi:hypothetical protein
MTNSIGLAADNTWITNYCVNFAVFNQAINGGAAPRVPSSFPDGAATTVMMYV